MARSCISVLFARQSSRSRLRYNDLSVARCAVYIASQVYPFQSHNKARTLPSRGTGKSSKMLEFYREFACTTDKFVQKPVSPQPKDHNQQQF